MSKHGGNEVWRVPFKCLFGRHDWDSESCKPNKVCKRCKELWIEGLDCR